MDEIRKGGILKAVKKSRGGIMVAHHKDTKDLPVVRMPAPEFVTLPMQQHIGAPCTPTVKVGDTVAVGQVIGDTDKFVSAPIHASVSGTVKSIGEVRLPSGMITQAVTIESDGEMRLFDGIEPPKVETKDDLIKAVRQSGLVGLGGAGFPSHVKLAFDESKGIDTLVINAAECEPYITVDYRECIDNSWDIFSSIYTLKDLLGFKKIIIAVEDNKPDAIKVLKDIADSKNDVNDSVKIMTLKSKYPQGAEKMMVLSATGRKVPPGKLPADVGCVVMNVTSASFISRYLKTGKPLVSRSLTVAGDAIANPQNVRVPIGTKIKEIIDFCGGYSNEPYKLIAGGPMMGMALVDDQGPILKSNNAILAFSDTKKIKKEVDCIRCGRCAKACPMSLIPTNIEKYTKIRDIEKLKNSGIMVCMECGSCSYSCPAGKALVQHMRLAKSVLREAEAKK
ncbi:MAG: electron transport complex subunit RsxC [Clostridiales bacterium]|nr:electron transport complex subunit RsxC [Clostridiales bacterium]